MSGPVTFETWAYFTNVGQFAVDQLTIRLDIDAGAFQTATIVGGPATAETAAKMDPREANQVQVLVQPRDQDGDLPPFPGLDGYTPNLSQSEWFGIRECSIDWLTGRATIQASSAEVIHKDARYAGTSVYDTAVTNLYQLAQYGIGHGYAAAVTDRMSAAAVAIPAGDRRLIQPGESYADFFESELSAAGGRLFSAVGKPYIADREDPPRDQSIVTLTLSTTPDLDGVPVVSVTETRSIDGDWADCIMVRYEYTNGAGNQVTSYQVAGHTTGNTQRRALLLDRDRAPSGSNLAASILGRSILRGQAFEAVCMIDFRVRPGVKLTLARPDGNIDLGLCRAVEYRVHEGRMTVTSQIDEPIE
nr:hypothetical protein [Microbacterium bovistercoris]